MPEPDCLYSIAFVPHEAIEPLLLDHFAPLAREIRDHPDLDSLFFVRFSEPRWQLRFRVLGNRDWVQGALRARLAALLAARARAGEVEQHRFATYDREWERYGGELGMRLAERLFFLDSMLAIELCEAERRGQVAKPRRELALLIVDRLLDLAGFERRRRLAFYRHGYSWALETGEWGARELELLERRFRANQGALERLFEGDLDQDARWGGRVPAGLVRGFTDAATPVLQRIVREQDRGAIRQDLVYLMWSYAHMFTNRMGIESSAEAISRFFVHRLLEERRPAAV